MGLGLGLGFGFGLRLGFGFGFGCGFGFGLGLELSLDFAWRVSFEFWFGFRRGVMNKIRGSRKNDGYTLLESLLGLGLRIKVSGQVVTLCYFASIFVQKYELPQTNRISSSVQPRDMRLAGLSL